MNQPTHPPHSSTSQRALSIDATALIPTPWIGELFERLGAIVGKEAMDRVYGGMRPEVVKAEWADALAGFSADEIRRGLAAMRTRKFPPALPDFVLACRPALDPDVAWTEAEFGIAAHDRHEAFAWSHPAVYWAAAAMRLEVRSGNYRVVNKRWARTLANEFAKGAWAAPPDPTQRALPAATAPSSFVDPERVRLGKEALKHIRRLHTGFATRAEEQLARPDEESAGRLSPEARAALIAAGAPGTSTEQQP